MWNKVVLYNISTKTLLNFIALSHDSICQF